MGSKHSKNTLRQRTSVSKRPQKIIVYVEGRNTEKSYINLLKKSNLTLMPVVRPGGGIGSCLEFVDNCINAFNSEPKAERDKYTQKWLMFDYDGHFDFAQAIKKARANDFQVAFSSMCIEYWFLLHFDNHDGKPIPLVGSSHSQAQINMLNHHISLYNQALPPKQTKVNLYDSGSKNVEPDLFELMLAIDSVSHNRRVEDACQRSYNIHSLKRANGSEFAESVTAMHQFLETIGIVKRDSKGVYKYLG